MFEEKDNGTLIREVMQHAFRKAQQPCDRSAPAATEGVFERLLERLSQQDNPAGGHPERGH